MSLLELLRYLEDSASTSSSTTPTCHGGKATRNSSSPTTPRPGASIHWYPETPKEEESRVSLIGRTSPRLSLIQEAGRLARLRFGLLMRFRCILCSHRRNIRCASATAPRQPAAQAAATAWRPPRRASGTSTERRAIHILQANASIEAYEIVALPAATSRVRNTNRVANGRYRNSSV